MSDFRLKVFRSAARHLSLTKAAEEMCITQPAVTRHIKEIEAEYGQRVFERTGGKLVLTEAGRTLLAHAGDILEGYDRLEYDMKQLSGECAGQLRIGASTTIAQYILPPVLASFTARHPNIRLLLFCANTEEVEHALARHDIDLGFVEGIGHRQSLHYTEWLKDELVAVVSTTSPLAVKDEITLADLRQIPVVLREPGSGTLGVWQSALRHKNIPLTSLRVIAHIGHSESIKRFIMHSEAMAILSVRAVSQEVFDGTLKIIDIKDLPLERMFHIVRRQGQENSVAEKFLQYLLKHKPDLCIP